MTLRRRRLVRVPASSANLGPGFDVLAAALDLQLEVEVRETGTFAVHTPLDVPRDRSNLVVRGFERLHSAEGFEFTISSQIPLSGGLGSSAAALLAGLMAADHIFELDADLFALGVELEGHPDNIAAALDGGFVICVGGGSAGGEQPVAGESTAGEQPVAGGSAAAEQPMAGESAAAEQPVARVGIEPPMGLEAVVVVPSEPVQTEAARAALPASVPLADAMFNVAHAATLVLGLARADWDLIAAGLRDRLHQPARGRLYPRSAGLLERAQEIGALGATISGAGPSVLFWCQFEQTGRVLDALEQQSAGWGRAMRVTFESRGADVREL